MLLGSNLIVLVPDDCRTWCGCANAQTQMRTHTMQCDPLIHSSLSCLPLPLSNRAMQELGQKWTRRKTRCRELCDAPHKQHPGCWAAWDEGMFEIMWEDKLQREGINWWWISGTHTQCQRQGVSVEARQKIKDYVENTEETLSTPHCCSPEGDAFHV